MASANHNTGSNPAPQPQGFEVLREQLNGAMMALRGSAELPDRTELNSAEVDVVNQVAAFGVLKQLQARRIEGAETLAEQLELMIANGNQSADMLDVVARFRTEQAAREEGTGVDAQNRQAKLGLLAEAVSDTARTAVVATFGGHNVPGLVTMSRSSAEAARDPYATQVLTGLLDEIKAADQPPSETLDPSPRSAHRAS